MNVREGIVIENVSLAGSKLLGLSLGATQLVGPSNEPQKLVLCQLKSTAGLLRLANTFVSEDNTFNPNPKPSLCQNQRF
jgi:hypothetical protein